MATKLGTDSSTDAAIIARMVHPDKADLTDDAAEAVLRIFRRVAGVRVPRGSVLRTRAVGRTTSAIKP